MRPFTFFISIWVLSCNGSPGNNLPKQDSSQSAGKDTPMAQAPAPEKDTTQLGGQWFLQPVLVSDTAAGKIPRLVLDINAKKFTGNTGCNNMSGQFDFTDSTLQFNQRIITTKMACVGYNEKEFLETLLRTNTYKLQSGTLILLFDQTELSRWTRKVAPKPVVNKT
ncbi:MULTISPECIES: META domain-containing protein [Niastella]|uniref:META domain-containing protein n=1 Tax=Niastella soli TaxID=2821487 RepID=A0ABS3YQ19_9BACT|nr:META domain-containing protein [Niastella soli]MBO9199677.1 META domain-containing protein [Niastella soli]